MDNRRPVFLAAVGTFGNGPLQFRYPTGIVVNTVNSKIYMSDSSNNRIQVLNSDLTFSSSFGQRGSGEGQFDQPRGITCDSAGKLYVADRKNNRIQVFTAEDKFLRMFGEFGSGRGELNYPMGVAVDSNNMVYTAEPKQSPHLRVLV